MYTNAPLLPKQSYRDLHRRRYVPPRSQPLDERVVSKVNENVCIIKLRRRRRPQAIRSFYDNNEDDEDESIESKWTIVRQRLPDILALSETYKPTSVRAQLVLLITLMNKQASKLTNQRDQLNQYEFNNTISHIVPSNVILDLSGRRQLIHLKRIPSEQVIHVDVDGLSFSIPTRQFILAISRGYARETAAKYCPPAISDMLIDISKTKFIDESRQYKRAQVKMRIGQMTFVFVYIFIIIMVFVLIPAATKTIVKFKSDSCYNETSPCIVSQQTTSNKSFNQ